jgi:hypothetical protein
MKVGDFTANYNCPEGLEQVNVAAGSSSRKLCRKTVDSGCSSVIFPTHGMSYSKVCGQVYGYNKDSTDGFYRHSICTNCSINEPYIDGVSITRGNCRQHIWTLAATTYAPYCPCSNNTNALSFFPSFVEEEDYFCEAKVSNTYHHTKRVWNGRDCLSGAEQCCERGDWFCKELPQPTTDDIEFRVCTDQPRADEDVYIEWARIYVQ